MADTALVPIPGQVDPVPVARDITPRADGRIDLIGLPKDRIRTLFEEAGLEAKQAKELIDWYRASIGHDACKPPAVRWVEPLVPANAAAPVHPNLLGMIGAANLVVAAAGG